MPIRAANKLRYPKDWHPRIVPRIRARSGNRCECIGECGDHIDLRCEAVNATPHPMTGAKVVLTVAHLDHTPEHCDDTNLRHWCQLCHNRYDAPVRRAGIRERRKANAQSRETGR
jgi:hypothetical protein